MYKYITKNKGAYTMYVIFLVLSSLFGVLFSFVMGGIMDAAVQGNASLLLRYTVGGTVFLLITVATEYLYGVVKNRLIKKARTGVKEDMLARLMERDTLSFEKEKTSVYVSNFLQNLDMLENLYFNNVLETACYAAVNPCLFAVDDGGCEAHDEEAAKEHEGVFRVTRRLYG